MPRYAAFLRGVSPMNLKMRQLKECCERADFTGVRTLLASGNVVFDCRAVSESAIERKAEAAMQEHLGRTFLTIVRRVDSLIEMIDADPFADFKLPSNAKRVVTFLREPPAHRVNLPREVRQARILAIRGREIFTAYIPQQNSPVFMALIEKTFGKDVTTRTWDTVKKCAVA